MTELRIVFDGPPGPEAGRFVEVENEAGASVNAGEWVERPDGYWELRIQQSPIKLPEDDGNPPGRQTSPEVAVLAGRLMNHEDPEVRSLAASALGSVME